jgi:ATP/maltotriose-dependent transcriptional regulator MalT/DNA-binding SARP family transcriptional activator
VAGAGFGKTFGLEEALVEFNGSVVWVSCSAEDPGAGRLLLDLIGALRQAMPGAADVLGRQLTAGVEPVVALASLDQLLEELDHLLVEPLAIVLDDAERLEASPAALGLVQRLLTKPPPSVRIAIASRRPLPLETAKLEASGELTEFGVADLAFTTEECHELLSQRSGSAASASEVESMMATTEGWPLGIALTGPGAGELAGPPRSREKLFHFLAQDVLGRLDREMRRAVLDSGLPNELDAEVSAALRLPADFVEDVQGLGLFFTERMEGGRRWLRHHPLVHEFLRERFAEERDDGEVRELNARVAEAMASAGRGTDAVEHWLASERWQEAAGAIVEAAPGLLGTSPETVRRWLERLPPEVRAEPPILMLRGVLEYGAGEHDRAASFQRDALAAYESRGESPGTWMARIALMNTLHASGGFDEAVDLARELDAPEARDLAAAPNIAVMAAMCLSHQGRFDEAAAMNRRALEHPAAGASAALARACEGLFVDRPAGRLDDAARKAREALADLGRSDPFDRMPFVRALLHLVLEEQGLDDEALAESLRAQEEARALGVRGYLVSMLQLHSVGIHARAGRLAEAQRQLDLAAPDEAGAGWRQLGVGQATLAAARGDYGEATAQAERTIAKVVDGPFLQRVHACCFLAPVLVSAGQADRALQIVDETLAAWQPGYFKGRILAVRAWLRHRAGEQRSAFADIGEAWRLTGDQRPHLVRREWPQLERLLWDALEQGVIDPEEATSAIQAAFPGDARLSRLADHPVPSVRRAAIGPALISGHPEAAAKLIQMSEDSDPRVQSAARAAVEQLRLDPPPLRFKLLGRFEAARGLWTVAPEDWQRPMASKLIRFLLAKAAPVAEDEIFETFWPEKDPPAARRNLQVTISQARSVLDPPGSERSVISSSERTYGVVLRDRDQIDAEDFVAAARSALAEQGDRRRSQLEQAEVRWTGEPLPEDRFEDWSIAWRERLRDLYAEVVGALLIAAREDGDTPAELRAARRLVEIDALNEEAQRALIAAYARNGRRGDALHQFLECRRALVETLGVEPSADTTRLHARVLAGEPV